MKIVFSFLFCCACFVLVAQVDPVLEAETASKMSAAEKNILRKASEMVQQKHYLQAETHLDTLYQSYPDDEYLNFLAGICKVFLPGEEKQALLLIQNAYGIKHNLPDYDYYIGYAYEQNEKYDDALKFYEFYSKKPGLGPDMKAAVQRRIEICSAATQASGKNVIIRITNIGSPVNTSASEYVPCIPSDESFMVFTYQGEKSKGGRQSYSSGVKDRKTGQPIIESIFFEDVFITQHKPDGGWTSPAAIETINTVNHDASVALSHDGMKLIIYRNVGAGKGDLYLSVLEGSSWSKPEKIRGINTLEWEGSACFSPDELHVVFSSERPGGEGGRDLWIAELMRDGSWGNVKNLGDVINTKYDEDSPFITADGKTLFFSSNNSMSLGGYDIFRCDREGDGWGAPVNVGKPVNTTQDDKFYVVSADGKRGYYSSGKPGGSGGQDIYLVSPGKTGRPIALVQATGNVTRDSLPASASISVRSRLTHKDIFAPHTANSVTGKFLLNLPAGDEYEIIFKMPGFPDQVKELNATFVDSFFRMTFIADFNSKQLASVNEEIDKEGYEALSGYGNKLADSLYFTVEVARGEFPRNYNYTTLIGFPKVNKLQLSDRIVRFTVGNFATFNKALEMLSNVKKKAFPEARVIAVYKGKRYSLTDLVKNGILK